MGVGTHQVKEIPFVKVSEEAKFIARISVHMVVHSEQDWRYRQGRGSKFEESLSLAVLTTGGNEKSKKISINIKPNCLSLVRNLDPFTVFFLGRKIFKKC
jgi:hypothetical protein